MWWIIIQWLETHGSVYLDFFSIVRITSFQHDFPTGAITELQQNLAAPLQQWPTFLCQHPQSSLWWRALSLGLSPRCPCVGRRWWRITSFWAGWWGVAWADCLGPHWASRWGSWQIGSGCPVAQCYGLMSGCLASNEVYCDSWEKTSSWISYLTLTIV